MEYIYLCLHLVLVAGLSVAAFRLGGFVVSWTVDNWFSLQRVSLSVIDENGGKKSQIIWLDKRKKEDAELIKLLNDIGSDTKV
jgi:hypothetical protein